MNRLAIALPLLLAGAAESRAEEPVSGYRLLSPEMQEMQDDEFTNPGMLTVEAGREFFSQPGLNGRACADCHGVGGSGLEVERIASYPIYDPESQRVLTLRAQIDACRDERMEEFPEPYESRDLLALETFVRYLARGEPVQVELQGPISDHYERGKAMFETRFGQLNMSCAHCHEIYPGFRLRSQTLSQGHTNAFPAYRLTPGRVVGLHRKFVDCYITLRAEPYPVGSPEYIDLEVYMTARGNGLPIETPGIRR
jgi:sulfur-oxidizing protein SoxA